MITVLISGRSRAIRRTRARNLASPVWVTVHELMTAASALAGSSAVVAPASSRAWRTNSVSYWLALHPKVCR